MDMLDNYTSFLDRLFEKIDEEGFDVKDLQLDHIAYYTSSGEEYDELKPSFEKLGKFEHEAIVNKRRVGVIKLNEPITYKEYKIEAVELVEPKEGEIHSSGWEHVEFVTEEDYDTIIENHQGVDWEVGGKDRPSYSHITAIFDEHSKVKFHHRSILESIELEKSQK